MARIDHTAQLSFPATKALLHKHPQIPIHRDSISSRESLVRTKMSSSNSSGSKALPFRSKKPLKSIQKSKDVSLEDLDPMSMKTPEKPLQLPRRTRNRNVALSLTEVRKAAERLREPRDQLGDRTDQIVSARRKIVDFPELGDASSAKPKCRSSGGNKLPEK